MPLIAADTPAMTPPLIFATLFMLSALPDAAEISPLITPLLTLLLTPIADTFTPRRHAYLYLLLRHY